MKQAIAFIILAAALIGLTVLVCVEHRPQGVAMPLIHASEPASVVPWRLFTVCTPTQKNVPRYREREA